MEHLGRTNTHHMYTHSVKRWVHLDRVEAERWSILAGHTHTTCTHILSKDGCILTESRPKDGASWPDKHTPHVHTFCQKMGAESRPKDGASWPDKHTTCTHILSKDGCILTESRPKDGASWPDKHTPHVHTFCQKMGAS